MPYTNATWDETTPAGGSQVSAGDDSIRSFKVDIRERLETFFVDIDDDPLVAQPDRLLKTGQVLVIGPYACQPTEDDDDAAWNAAYYLSDNTGGNSTRMNIPVLANWKITKVETLFNLDGEVSVDISFKKTTFTATSVTDSTINMETVTVVGLEIVEVFNGEETTDGESYYYLQWDGTNAGRYRIYGVRIYYDEVEGA